MMRIFKLPVAAEIFTTKVLGNLKQIILPAVAKRYSTDSILIAANQFQEKLDKVVSDQQKMQENIQQVEKQVATLLMELRESQMELRKDQLELRKNQVELRKNLMKLEEGQMKLEKIEKQHFKSTLKPVLAKKYGEEYADTSLIGSVYDLAVFSTMERRSTPSDTYQMHAENAEKLTNYILSEQLYILFMENLAAHFNIPIPPSVDLKNNFFSVDTKNWIIEFKKQLSDNAIYDDLIAFVSDEEQRSNIVTHKPLGLLFLLTTVTQHIPTILSNSKIQIDCRKKIHSIGQEPIIKIEIGQIKQLKSQQSEKKGREQLQFRLSLVRNAVKIIYNVAHSNIHLAGRLIFINSDRNDSYQLSMTTINF